MLAISALAQLALCEFPVSKPTPIPPIPPRLNPLGIITTIDAVSGMTYGTVPTRLSPFVLLINLGFPISPLSTLGLTLLGPTGQVRIANTNYLFAGPNIALLYEQTAPKNYLIYTVAPSDNINEIGIWKAIVTVDTKTLGPFLFTVS